MIVKRWRRLTMITLVAPTVAMMMAINKRE